jgi:hypothetical protein
MKDYILVKSFTYNERTVCRAVGTNTIISSEEALEGARYGWYECRVMKGQATESCARYVKDNSDVVMVIGLGTIVTVLALVLGKG